MGRAARLISSAGKQKSAASKELAVLLCIPFRLFLGDDGAVGAGVAARTAVQASGRIDHVLIVALADSADGANVCAGTAADASRSNLISHVYTPPLECAFIVSYNF